MAVKKKKTKTAKQIHNDQLGRFLKLCSERYVNDIVLFSEEVLGLTPTDQQREAMELFVHGKGKIAIKSGHGTGKSCTLAVCVLWFLCCFELAEVRMTAPSSSQLYSTMMKEIRLWYSGGILDELEAFEFTKDHVRVNHSKFSNNWFAKAVSVANPENISGAHATNLLIVVDEAAGVDGEVFYRLDGAMTTKNTRLIMAGNPSYCSGYFYDVFNKEEYASKYDLLTFNSEDSPNVEESFIQEMREKYGVSSNIYRVRVLGEFAPLDEETIIARHRVKSALARDIEEVNSVSDTLHIGIDLSSGTGNDNTVISIRRGNAEVNRIKVKRKLRESFEMTKDIIERNRKRFKKIVVNVDTTGLGSQFGQDLHDYYDTIDNVEVNEINFSFRASDSETYGNIYTEMFFQLEEKIEEIKLFNLEESTVEEELGSRRFGYSIDGRYVVEKKKEFIKRSGNSPDEGDAVLLAFYEPQDNGIISGRIRLL